MAIEHVNIPDGQIHEPKGISTALVGEVYHADGASSGSWRKSTEADLNYSDKTQNRFGWIDVADTSKTSGSPLTLTAATETTLVNNGLASQSDTSRFPSPWNTAGNKFLFSDTNSVYFLRTFFKITTASAAGTPYVVKVKIKSSAGITLSSNDVVFKGGGYVNEVSITDMIYIGSSVSGTDVTVTLTADTNSSAYDIGFVLQKAYIEG